MIEADRLQICDVEKPSLLTNEAIKKEIGTFLASRGSNFDAYGIMRSFTQIAELGSKALSSEMLPPRPTLTGRSNRMGIWFQWTC